MILPLVVAVPDEKQEVFAIGEEVGEVVLVLASLGVFLGGQGNAAARGGNFQDALAAGVGEEDDSIGIPGAAAGEDDVGEGDGEAAGDIGAFQLSAGDEGDGFGVRGPEGAGGVLSAGEGAGNE
jgi:hypothetical protein